MSAKIKIDEVEYTFPRVPEMTLDEAVILCDHSGLTLDKIEETDGFHPGLIRGLIAVAITRAKPELSQREISERVGRIKIAEMTEIFAEVDEESPPEESPASETEEPPAPSGEPGPDEAEPSPEPVVPASTGMADLHAGSHFAQPTSVH